MDVKQLHKFNRFIRNAEDVGIILVKEIDSDKTLIKNFIDKKTPNKPSNEFLNLIEKLCFTRCY